MNGENINGRKCYVGGERRKFVFVFPILALRGGDGKKISYAESIDLSNKFDR